MLSIPRKASVLCFSHDTSLSLTRQWMLERANCNCVAVTDMTQLRQAACADAFDLLVICQTISPEECAAAASFLAEHCPGARSLLMFSDAPRCQPAGNHVQLNIHAGPATFLDTVARMLPPTADVRIPMQREDNMAHQLLRTA